MSAVWILKGCGDTRIRMPLPEPSPPGTQLLIDDL
jgi:hypothetical protein